METRYGLLEVIEFLSKIENKDREFTRMNDENMVLYRGYYGDLLLKLPSGLIKAVPLFLYLQDLFILKEEI